MPKVKKIPLRQCIACREAKEKRDMLRVVKTPEDKIFLDFSGKASGRGADICDNPACIAKLKKPTVGQGIFLSGRRKRVYGNRGGIFWQERLKPTSDSVCGRGK